MPSTILTEDDIYRNSTQYKLWSYTPEALASLRATTNKTASERVVAAIKRHRKESKRKKAEEHASAQAEGETAKLNGTQTSPSNRDSNTPQYAALSPPAPPSTGNTSASQTPQHDPYDSESSTSEVDTLTVSEELKLITHYSRQLLRFSSVAFPRRLPRVVPSTAVQFFRRFYLSNSPMTYHPKEIFPTCLFLANKTENASMSLGSFVRRIQEPPIKSKMGAHDILAPEFFVTQGLRFTFDVRHPMTGLGAGWMELLAMARGEVGMSIRGAETDQNGTTAETSQDQQEKKTREAIAKSLQQSLLSLPPTLPWTDTTGEQTPGDPPARSVQTLERRIGLAHDRAKELLSEAALISDAYLLYSPAQIWLAALWVADEPLARCYLGTKIPLPASVEVTQDGEEKEQNAQGGAGNANENHQHDATRILDVITSCAAMLSAQHHGPEAQTPKEELIRIDKKLYHCRNPEKRDLVGLNRAVKSGQHDAAAKEERGGDGGGHDDQQNGTATGGQHIKREANDDDPDRADDYAIRNDRSPAKKRRVDVSKTMNADDVFGGPLKPP
ncbi:MAG: hypothetical protein M1831_006061 [Alyxoria varia]|nr:MAG: hypothetical protein M1831_006061 [Alyxoria varia]